MILSGMMPGALIANALKLHSEWLPPLSTCDASTLFRTMIEN